MFVGLDVVGAVEFDEEFVGDDGVGWDLFVTEVCELLEEIVAIFGLFVPDELENTGDYLIGGKLVLFVIGGLFIGVDSFFRGATTGVETEILFDAWVG